MNEPIHIISLGAGVQSSTMALMAAAGEIAPMPVGAIFADTKRERRRTMLWLDELEAMLPFPVHRVSRGNLREEALKRRVNQKTGKKYYSTYIPAFVKTSSGRGILRRKCTHDFKLLELIRKQKDLVGTAIFPWRRTHKSALAELRQYRNLLRVSKKQKTPPPMFPFSAWRECQSDPLAVIWIGMSMDETSRIKDSNVPWSVTRHPLVEKRMTKQDCVNWLSQKGIKEPPKSACIECPYHNDDQWRDLKENDPDEFAEAVTFEREFQAVCADGGAEKMPFLHDSLIPLDRVDFTRPSHKQGNLFVNECEGMCGV